MGAESDLLDRAGDSAAPAKEGRVRLLPAEASPPRFSRIPRAQSRRWRSPFEVGDSAPATQVFLSRLAFLRIWAHAQSDFDNEVGGVLLGKWRVDRSSGSRFVVVEGMLPARHTRHGTGFLTFTQESLLALHAEMELKHTGKLMLGWFHTHPHMGVFLSEYDLWLHEHFFPEAWQVALVIEPWTETGGFFIRGQDGQLDHHQYFGFHELLPAGEGSVVAWRNLRPESDVEREAAAGG